MNKNKGITLIALVVTIIVLIILAGISINLLLGDNGILKKAKDSASEQEIGQRKEAVSMAVTAEFANKNGDASLMTVEGVLKELQATQGSTSIYAKKGETEIRSTDGSTPLEGGETFHFPSGSDKEVVITLDENLNVRVAETQTVDNNNNNNNDNNQSQGGNQTGEGQEIDETLYGFFDANGNQLASWSTLIGAPYYMDIEKDFSYDERARSHGESGNSPYYVMQNANTLSGGAFTTADIVELRIPDSVTITANANEFNKNTTIGSTTLSDSIVNMVNIGTSTTKPITKIGKNTFRGNSILSKLVVGNNIKSIGEYSFYDCTNLSDLTLGNSVETVNTHAFSHCKIENLEIPSSLKYIRNYGFYYNKIKELVIPSTVKSIGQYGFACYTLEKVTIGDDISKVNESDLYLSDLCIRADRLKEIIIKVNTRTGSDTRVFDYDFNFQNSQNIEANVTICDGVSTIGCFSGLTTLKSITIPNSVTTIGSNAFYGCTNLESITIPNSVTSIGSRAFLACRKITSIEIPNSVTTLGTHVFRMCENLTDVVFGNSVTSIPSKTFEYCDKIENLTIGSSIESIADDAFSGSRNIESIIVNSNNTKYDSRNNCNAIIETATNKVVFGCKNTVIPNTVTSIGEKAFFNCSNLTSIEIPNGITNIGNKAFNNCKDLTSVTISDTVTTIGEYAFSECNNITNINISNGSNLKTIGKYAFSQCREVSNITIPSTVTTIGDHAFYYCRKLNNITIPNNVESIGEYAFLECYELSEVNQNGNWSSQSNIFDNTPYQWNNAQPATSTATATASY